MINIRGDFWKEIDEYHDHIKENYPEKGEDFVIPTRSEMEGLLNLAISMKIRDFAQAQAEIDNNNFPFELVKWQDSGNDEAVYFMVRERWREGIHRGWGCFVWARDPEYPWTIQCTHPIFDSRTPDVGARFFRYGAYSFFMHGTHRYSHPRASDQSGSFSDRIAKSDPSGTDLVPMLAFQIANSRDDMTFFQVHGFTKSGSNGRDQYPGVILSEASPASSGSTRVKAMAEEMRKTKLMPGLYHHGAFAGGHDSEESEGDYEFSDLGAETNRGAAWTNSFLKEQGHFIHLETETNFRLNAPQFTADCFYQAASRVFPKIDTWLYHNRQVKTRPLVARFNDADPSVLKVYMSGPLSNPGDITVWDSDLTLSSVSLEDAGFTVSIVVDSTTVTRGAIHYVSYIGSGVDKFGDPISTDETIYVEGVSSDDLFTGVSTPTSRVRKNLEMFPIADVTDQIICSGANIIRTRPNHPTLYRQHEGSIMLFKKRSKTYSSTFFDKNFSVGEPELWFRAEVFFDENLIYQTGKSIYIGRIVESETNNEDGARLNLRKYIDENDTYYGETHWQVRAAGGAGTNPSPSTRVKFGQWQTVEFCVRGGTANYELWIDGVQVAVEEFTSAATDFSHCRIGINYMDNKDTDMADIYMTGVMISRTRFGARQSYDKLQKPMLKTPIRVIQNNPTNTDIISEPLNEIEVYTPFAMNGEDVKVRASIYDETDTLLSQDDSGSTFVAHNKGTLTISLTEPFEEGKTLVLETIGGTTGTVSEGNIIHYQNTTKTVTTPTFDFETLVVMDQDRNVEALSEVEWDTVERKRTNSNEYSFKFNMPRTEGNKHGYDMLQEESYIIYKEDRYRVKRLVEYNVNDTPVKEVQARHVFFDIIDDEQKDVITGMFTLAVALEHALGPTEFTYEIINPGDIDSEKFQNFGDDNCSSLFNKVIERYGLEFIVEGTKVKVGKQLGEVTHAQLRHGHNLNTLKHHFDTSNLTTYVEGYGEVDEETDEPLVYSFYISPYADKYKDDNGQIKLKHTKTIRDARYTSDDALRERLKREIIDRPEYGIKVEYEEIKKNGVNIHEFDLGDTVNVIYEPLDVQLTPRVEEIIDFPFSERSDIITLGDLRNESARLQSAFAQTNKQVREIMDDGGNISLNTKKIYSNTEVYQDSMGHHYINPDDPERRVFIGSGGIDVQKGMMRVERADGYEWIQDGYSKHNLDIQGAEPAFMSNAVDVIGSWWGTTFTDYPVNCNMFSFEHKARYLQLGLQLYVDTGGECLVSIERGSQAGGNVEVLAQVTSTNEDPVAAERNKQLTIDLGVPDGNPDEFHLRMKSNVTDVYAYCRVIKRWLSDFN